MKQSIILIISILLFTACMERGNSLNPASNRIIHKMSLPIHVKTKRSHNITKDINTTKIDKMKEVKIEKSSIAKIPFFHFIETRNKTLSALAIVAIGIMILL